MRFKWWFQCAGSTGYLSQLDLYLGQKKDVEVNLGESAVMHLSEKLKGTYCTLLFDNVFNSPALIHKLFEDGRYAVGTVQSNRKQMLKSKEDKKMSRGESDFHYSKNNVAAKVHNKFVLFLATNIDGMSGASNVMRQTNSSATKA